MVDVCLERVRKARKKKRKECEKGWEENWV